MDEEKSKFDELNESLNSRTSYRHPVEKRSPIRTHLEPEVAESWRSPDLDEMLMADRRKQDIRSKTMKKIFFAAAIFFLLAVGAVSYIYLKGSNFISSKNVDISVIGPVSVRAGEPIELAVTVTNKNNATIEPVSISIQYPPGVHDVENPDKILNYIREELDKIGAGRSVTRNIKAVLFGEKGEIKQIKISVEYKVTGSNATFYKNKIYQMSIGEIPISMTVTKPSSVTSDEGFITTITLNANSSEVVRKVMVRAEYPYGYSVIESTPGALRENNLWSLGDLPPGSRKTLTIKGRLMGENEEERTFRFYVGIGDDEKVAGESFKTTLYSTRETILIKRPSVGLVVEFNGDNTSPYIAPLGKAIRTSVRFENNFTSKIFNPKLEVRLSGSALDKLSISPQDGGFYDSQGGKVVWDLKGDEGVAALSPGETGRVYFSFASNASAGAGDKEISVEVIMSGKILEDGEEKTMAVKEIRTIRIASQVTLGGKALYSRGPFTNSGPIPPKAENRTTYTAVITLGNTQNDIKESKVTAKLGSNVEWLNNVGPANENVTYDEINNTIIWNIGVLSSGAGFGSPTREVSFQMALTPSLGQVGSIPILVSGISFSGTDSFTSVPVSAATPTITTRIGSDPRYIQGDEVVGK